MLPFKDLAFDVVFSNSVIEHVGARADQERFAQEVGRVGHRYWIQTPNRHFPVELHVMFPFVHDLPKSWQRPILNRFTVWQLLVRPTEQERLSYVDHVLNDLNLLDASELQALFPSGTVISERVLGLPKSLVAIRS